MPTKQVRLCTCGEAGTVDWYALAEGCDEATEWTDPDFGHDETALWIDPDQPGGGAIGAILDMDVRALVIVFKKTFHVCAPCLSTPSGFVQSQLATYGPEPHGSPLWRTIRGF
jgi:hypothetical protein